MKISIAAVPYFWSKQEYFNFYAELCATPVEIIYLGETVCSKRRSMKLDDWLEIAEFISSKGKQAVLSTLTLLEAESELSYLTKIAKQKDFLIEANDLAAVQVASRNNHSFVAGSAINIYNQHSFKQFAKIGMTRWCIPVELGQADIQPILSAAQRRGIELEYQIFGRLPLAYSARCFTARHHQLPKDHCEFICQNYPEGLLANTQEGEMFAQINGIQTQSAKVVNLLNQIDQLSDFGIDILRLVPTNVNDTLAVIHWIYSERSSRDKLTLPNNVEFCNGYWHQIEGMKFID